MNENEKDKEIKKTSETYSYDDYEGDEMEEAQEGLEGSESSLLFDICRAQRGVSVSESREFEPGSSHPSEELRRKLLLRERWMTITGKKPRNIPVLKKEYSEFNEKFVCFGDRKPKETEQEIMRKLLISSKRIKEEPGLHIGNILHELMLPALSKGLTAVRFQAGTQLMANSLQVGGLQVRKTTTGKVLWNLKTMESTDKLPLRTLKFFPNSKKLFGAGECGVIQVFDTEDGEILGFSEPMGVINKLDISPEGNFLATGGRQGRVNVVDPQTLQITSTRSGVGNEALQPNVNDEYHKLRIYAIKFHPVETNVFASGGLDCSVKIWDVRTQGAIRSVKCPVICGDGVDLAGNTILTASWQAENGLSLWDFLSGNLIKKIPVTGKYTKFDGEFLYTARFLNNDPRNSSVNSNLVAVGGGGFTDMLILDVKTDKISQCFPSLKSVVCLDISGNLVAYGGKESIFRVGEIKLQAQSQKPSSKK